MSGHEFLENSMWDERYAREGFHFGTDPAAFLVAQAQHIADASNVLCVSDGEGRNSVYLAGLGHRVTAFDISPVGVDKARGLARDAGVAVDVQVAGIEDWDWSRQFDAVVAIFIQYAPPDLRARAFGWMGQAVRPGGVLLLHGYAPRQVGYGTGGPPIAEHMYTEPMVQAAFPGWEVIRSADYDADIDEGKGHSGRSALIDFVARKPV